MVAASLPLGSIIPKYRSYKEYSPSVLSYADVPMTVLALSEARALMFFGLRLSSSTRLRMVVRFSILVRLAIYLLLKCL